jgi:GDP-L-fucose synthase
MEKNSKIYIAGHNGMVGSAIHRNLVSNGYTNFVFTPYPTFDLTNQKTVADFFELEKPEYVILAAAKVGGIVANFTYRAQFIYENLMIQNNIIHQSYLHGVKKLLFLGSSCIYPKNCPQPIKEEYLLTGELEYTNEPYAIAKIAGIKMCEAYNIQYSTNFIAVMPTNLYGPNDNYNLEKSHVLPALIRKIHLGKCLENNDWTAIRKDLKKYPIEGTNENSNENEIIQILMKYGIKRETRNSKPDTQHPLPSAAFAKEGSTQQQAPSTQYQVSITLWGTGNPYREFLYVDDVAEACVFILNNVDYSELESGSSGSPALSPNPSPYTEIKNTHINIGTGKDLTIRELAELIKEITGFKGQLKWDDSKPDGTFRKWLDVSKLYRLGWKEKISLNEGLKIVYENYSKY